MQQGLFRESILGNLKQICDLLPASCSSILDNSLNLLVYEILTGLATSYKALIDRTISNNLDAIKQSEDLQGCRQWDRNF